MAFELYGLLDKEAPDVRLDTLASDLKELFGRTEGFQLELEEDPFDPSVSSLLLTWQKWWMRVFYEAGPAVAAASAEIADVAGDRREAISQIDRRIRVLCADDDARLYTNHIIFMMDFLARVPGVRVFDPQQQDFVETPSRGSGAKR